MKLGLTRHKAVKLADKLSCHARKWLTLIKTQALHIQEDSGRGILAGSDEGVQRRRRIRSSDQAYG